MINDQNDNVNLNKAEILQWLADIFSCFGPFQDLPTVSGSLANPDLKSQLETLASYLKDQTDKKGIQQVEDQLATLGTSYFEMRENGVPLPLYGSWWLEGRLQGDSTLEVQQILRDEELEVTVETADYLPTELEFISLLYKLEYEGEIQSQPEWIEKAKTLRKAFKKDYVQPWVHQMIESSHEHVDSPYWQVMIQILELVLQDDF